MFNADEFGELVRTAVDLSREVGELKRQLAGMVKVGTVAETDAKKGYRLDFGKDDNGQPKLSPWLPHPESGGKAKSWFPMSKGQVVAMMTPPGDNRQGILLRGGFTDQYKQPSQNMQENVFEYGNVRIEVKDGRVRIKAAAAEITMDGGVITFKASSIKFERA